VTYRQSVPALSVRQPWADLIVSGRKTIELRPWPTEYRGLLWIHAGKTAEMQMLRQFELDHAFRGGYVGAAVLKACIRLDASRWREWKHRHLADSDFPRGTQVWGWLLDEAVRFTEPIDGPGRLKLFSPSADIADLLWSAFQQCL
jgi:ASCH domain